jgi:hypothetical protein
MADSGYLAPTGRLVVKGGPARGVERIIETVTNMYPGRLVIRGSTDNGIKVADGTAAPVGFLAYEQTQLPARPQTLTTIFQVTDSVDVISGGGFTIYMPNGLYAGTYATQGDALLSWIDGKVIPGYVSGGKVAIKIPFTKQASEKSTGITLPAGFKITDCFVYCSTANGSGTIDVGLYSSEGGGDANGFLAAESLASTGYVTHNLVDGTSGNITLGALLTETTTKSADSGALYTAIPKQAFVTDGTAKTITYTTTNYTVAGYIYLVIDSPAVRYLGISGTTVDATSATAGVFVETMGGL